MVEAGVLREIIPSRRQESQIQHYKNRCRCRAATAEATAVRAGWPGVLDSMANTLLIRQWVSGRAKRVADWLPLMH